MPHRSIHIMELTSNQFASQLSGWYQKWAQVNNAYFPVEKRLSEKALEKGYLEIADLVDITRVLGNPHSIRSRVQSNNTADSVIQKTENSILNIGDPLKALQWVCSIKCWGLTYGSKTLRCICPQKYGALDSRIIDGVNRNYLPSNNNYVKYAEFLQLCEQIRQRVTKPGPRDKEKWYIADIEIALFQFLWNKENRLL